MKNSQHPLYPTYKNMLDRCLNPNSSNYKDYGGRGITVSPEWQASFETFAADMGERPEGHTLDRLDNNKGYSRFNCRWATKLEQVLNTRVKKKPRFQKEQATISVMLKEFHNIVVLRSEPQPAVFLDHEPQARFFAADWPTVYELVLFYITMKLQNTKPKSLLNK